MIKMIMRTTQQVSTYSEEILLEDRIWK